MRITFLIVVIANVVLLAYGQGFFGTPPAEQGRTPHAALDQRNEQAVIPGDPR